MIGAELGTDMSTLRASTTSPVGRSTESVNIVLMFGQGRGFPHCWLDDGTALQDRLPETYILLCLGNKSLDTSQLRDSYKAIGAPVSEVRIESSRIRDLYGFDFLILRPDMHVVWRGTDVPQNSQEIASISTGHGRHD